MGSVPSDGVVRFNLKHLKLKYLSIREENT